MRRSLFGGVVTVLAAAAVIIPSAPLQAEGLFQPRDESPRLMLFAQKAFGAEGDPATLPRLGLRLENPVDAGLHRGWTAPEPPRFAPLAEYAFTAGRGHSVRLSDIPMFDSAGSLGTEESWGKPSFWAVLTVAALGVSCLADNWPCDDDDDDYTPPQEPDVPTG